MVSRLPRASMGQLVLLTPPKSSQPRPLLSRQQSAPISPLACNTYGSPRKCCKQKTCTITKSFRCNTYKNRGWWPPPCDLSTFNPSSLLLSITRHLFTLSGDEGSLFSSSPFNDLHTLLSSVSRKSFACHSYENCRVYTNNSQSGTYSSPASFVISLSPYLFASAPLPLPTTHSLQVP